MTPVPFNFLCFTNGKIYGVVDMIRFSNYIYREGRFKTPYELARFRLILKKCEKFVILRWSIISSQATGGSWRCLR